MHRISASDEALNYLRRRSRTRAELCAHLAGKGYDEREIELAVEYLESFHYLDDFSYALNYIDMSIEKGRGDLRIRRELMDKGISSEIVDEAFCEHFTACDSVEDMRHAQLKRAAAQIADIAASLRGNCEIDDKLIAKIGRRLNSKGYDVEIISTVICAVREDRLSEYEV